MNIEEKMMPIDEWNKQFSCKYMQQPISFLTEENLDRLQQHCEKTLQYGNGRILEEHQVTLELIIRYKELKTELEKEKEKNKELSSQIDEHVYNGCDYELCNKKWLKKIKALMEKEDKLFFETKDVRHANRYKAYKELIKEE